MGTGARIVSLAAAAGLVLGGGCVPVHSVLAQRATSCSFVLDLDASPGLSLQPGPSRFTSGGETGTLTCDGPVNGLQPTGPGAIGVLGDLSGSCTSAATGDGGGSGTETLTVPTSGGAQRFTSRFTFSFGRRLPTHGGLVAGEFTGDHFSGSFEFTPVQGDCVSRPVTRAHVVGEGLLH